MSWGSGEGGRSRPRGSVPTPGPPPPSPSLVLRTAFPRGLPKASPRSAERTEAWEGLGLWHFLRSSPPWADTEQICTPPPACLTRSHTALSVQPSFCPPTSSSEASSPTPVKRGEGTCGKNLLCVRHSAGHLRPGPLQPHHSPRGGVLPPWAARKLRSGSQPKLESSSPSWPSKPSTALLVPGLLPSTAPLPTPSSPELQHSWDRMGRMGGPGRPVQGSRSALEDRGLGTLEANVPQPSRLQSSR